MFHSPAGQWTARQALIKDRTAAKARLGATHHCLTVHCEAMSREGYSLLTRQIKRRLKQIELDLSQVAETIDAIIAADKELRVRANILTSIPGIAKVTACAILT